MRVSSDQTTQGIYSLVGAFTAGSHKTEAFEFVIVQLYELYGDLIWQNRPLYDKTCSLQVLKNDARVASITICV